MSLSYSIRIETPCSAPFSVSVSLFFRLHGMHKIARMLSSLLLPCPTMG